jgi:hypothetical protein
MQHCGLLQNLENASIRSCSALNYHSSDSSGGYSDDEPDSHDLRNSMKKNLPRINSPVMHKLPGSSSRKHSFNSPKEPRVLTEDQKNELEVRKQHFDSDLSQRLQQLSATNIKPSELDERSSDFGEERTFYSQRDRFMSYQRDSNDHRNRRRSFPESRSSSWGSRSQSDFQPRFRRPHWKDSEEEFPYNYGLSGVGKKPWQPK